MSIHRRNNINISGSGSTTMIFAHGFGCDQNMWRYTAPDFQDRFRVVLFDFVGSGNSDITAYDYDKYSSLDGYADDVLEIIETLQMGPVIFVGHSVGATIGMLAGIKAPHLFHSQIMVGPSPCYINEGDYVGGFSREDIEELCNTLDSNYLGWSSTMAPVIMGAPDQPELSVELTNSFCRNDPEIAQHFARTTFLSDYRDAVPKCTVPSLILQCSDDFIAPRSVGEFMCNVMPQASLCIIENVGHCPHLSSPHASITAMNNFLTATAA